MAMFRHEQILTEAVILFIDWCYILQAQTLYKNQKMEFKNRTSLIALKNMGISNNKYFKFVKMEKIRFFYLVAFRLEEN